MQLTPMELEFHSGDSVEFQMFKQTENLDEDFEISDGVILPVGAATTGCAIRSSTTAPSTARSRAASSIRSAISGTATAASSISI